MHTWSYHLKYNLPIALMLLASVALAAGFFWCARSALKARTLGATVAWTLGAVVCFLASPLFFYLFGVRIGIFRL